MRHSQIIDAFTHRYNIYIENRSQLRKKLIEAIQKGELSDEAKSVVDSIYSEGGVYDEADRLSIQLVKLESGILSELKHIWVF